MITSLDKKQLTEIGSRFRGAYLLEQAGYTLALARGSDAVVALLPQGLLDEAGKAVAAVEKGMRDRAIVAAEARDATRVQNDTLRGVREWRRRLAALARMAARSGAAVPAELAAIGGSAHTVPAALRLLQESIGLLRRLGKPLEPFPLYHLVLGEAESLAVSLAAVDAAQEVKLLAERPAAVRGFYAAKAVLYIALKIVNDAGRAANSADPAAAARFNLAILYRGANRPAPVPPVPPPA